MVRLEKRLCSDRLNVSIQIIVQQKYLKVNAKNKWSRIARRKRSVTNKKGTGGTAETRLNLVQLLNEHPPFEALPVPSTLLNTV